MYCGYSGSCRIVAYSYVRWNVHSDVTVDNRACVDTAFSVKVTRIEHPEVGHILTRKALYKH